MKEYKYKVMVLAAGEKEWAGNGLRFDTEIEAAEYGKDLFNRWTALVDWKVVKDEEDK